MKRWPISFAIILPLTELFVAALILAVPAALVYLNLENIAHGTGVAHIEFGQFSQTIPRENFVSYATQTSSFESSGVLSALNMPGFFGELLVSLPTTWPESWHPSGISLMSWRAVVFPIFSVPAWLLVGCGIDTLLGWRKLHWSVLLLGTLLCLLFAILFAGLEFGVSASERGEVVFPLWGLGLWSVLFATLPAVWIRRWRDRRATARQTKSAIAA
jgi:hypothetical protein